MINSLLYDTPSVITSFALLITMLLFNRLGIAAARKRFNNNPEAKEGTLDLLKALCLVYLLCCLDLLSVCLHRVLIAEEIF